MSIVNELKFTTESIVPLLSSSPWILEDSTYLDTFLLIKSKGKAKIDISNLIQNKVFMYYKIIIDYTSKNISSISNFKNLPYLFITETYKNEKNEIFRNRTRALGFNIFNPVGDEEGHYIDTTIFKSLNKPLAYYTLEIRNNTDEDLIINNLGVFTSIDISGEQVSDIFNTVQAETEPESFKIYTDENYSTLNGLAVTLKNSDKELKYKPIYKGGLLNSIETNFGMSYPVVYVTENIDLET